MNRDARDRLLELVEEGLVDPNYVILAFCKWNTREDIEEMCHANEIELWDEEGEDDDIDDDMDGDWDSAMASAGYGTDEDYGYFGE